MSLFYIRCYIAGIVIVLCCVFSPRPVYALDSNYIQHQIDILPATGGVVTLPKGIFTLSTANGSLDAFRDGTPIKTAILVNKNNVTIVGQGSDTILKLAPHAKMRVLSISAQNVTIKNMMIDGNRAGRDGTQRYPGGDTVDSLLYSDHKSANILFENLEVIGGIEGAVGAFLSKDVVARNNYLHDNGTPMAGGGGLGFSGVKGGKAINNRLEKNNASGIWIAFDSQNIEIRDNVIRGNHASGLTIGAATELNGISNNNTGFVIENNVLSGNGVGNGGGGFPSITIIASRNGVLRGNKIENSPYDNIQISGKTEAHSINWLIANNTCGGPSQVGIKKLSFADSITLTANTCQSNVSQEDRSSDLNVDGKIDIFDYNLLLANFGKTGANGFVPADIDKNGKVDVFDYNRLISNYNK